MKTLYFDCSMGAAGDMLMSSLYELIDGKEAFLNRMNQLGIPGVSLAAAESIKGGIAGTHLSVSVRGKKEETADVVCPVHVQAHIHKHTHGHGNEFDHMHEHFHENEHYHEFQHGQVKQHDHFHKCDHEHGEGLAEIERLIGSLAVSENVRENAVAVYRLIADAESAVHGRPVDNIHFHEVGTMDAVADIVGVCLLIEELSPESIIASPVYVGSGHVRCAHGILPVPAPATAHILKGIPICGGMIEGELCTPTGAALLKHFVVKYGNMPNLIIEKIGYGMGTKDYAAVSCLRAFLGES